MPWPVYAFGAAPIGLLLGGVGRGDPAVPRYLRRAASSGRRREPPVGRWPPPTPVDGGPGGSDGESRPTTAPRRDRPGVGDGLIADEATPRRAGPGVGGLVVVLAAEIAAAVAAGPAGHPALLAGGWHGLATVVAVRVIAWPAGWSRCCARRTPTRPGARPSEPCGTWPRSGRGRCTRSRRPATPSGPCPRSWTGSGC